MVQGTAQYNIVNIATDMLASSQQVASKSVNTDIHAQYDFSGVQILEDCNDRTWHELSTYDTWPVEPSFPEFLTRNYPVEHNYRTSQSYSLDSPSTSVVGIDCNSKSKCNKNSTSPKAARRTTVRRRTQNRLAQRAYRQRKADQIRELETRLADALTALQMLSSENGDISQTRQCSTFDNNIMNYWAKPKLEEFESKLGRGPSNEALDFGACDTSSENNLKQLLCEDWVLESLSDQSTY
jgi:hypothetical protein